MRETGGFYTMKGYLLKEAGQMTNAMEDYLEMIMRLSENSKKIRVNELSGMLHVKAPSVTKMVQHLADAGYLTYEKYGEIALTEKGVREGEYLLYRHDVLHRFLCYLNHSGNELEQVEKIEHFLERRTIVNIEALMKRLSTGSGKARRTGKVKSIGDLRRLSFAAAITPTGG